MRINRCMVCFLIAALLIGVTGCISKTDNSNLKTENQSVQLDDAKRVSVNAHMGAGTLGIQNGTDKLMEGEFIYNVPEWKPTIAYSRTGDNGILNIEQPSFTTNISIGDNRNEWNLKLNKNVPTDLSVYLGAGNSNLRLNGMNLSSLQVKMGAGELAMDLSGAWGRDVTVDVSGGVGKTTITLPKSIAVIVDVSKGIGSISADGFRLSGDSYVNDAYGKSDITMRVKISTGVGETKLILSN
ncbi:MAG: toast rack family protein [Firmicutes bacterium]|nr:toast rack family protein [Bacillota bacterium]